MPTTKVMKATRLSIVGSSSVSISPSSHLVAIARIIIFAALSLSVEVAAFPLFFVLRGGIGISDSTSSSSPKNIILTSKDSNNKNINIGLKMASTSDDPTTTTSPWTPGNAEQENEARSKLDIWPLDEYNAQLLNQVHPRGYEDVPKTTIKPHDVYDLIAIGSGAGGLVSSRQVRAISFSLSLCLCLRVSVGVYLIWHLQYIYVYVSVSFVSPFFL